MTSTVLNHEIDEAPETLQASSWSQHLQILALAVLGILLVFWRDASDMVSMWWNISTYNHCLLIVPILFWLVQQRQEELRKISPMIWSPGLLWMAIASFGWMLGEAAGVSFARHLGVLMLLQGAVMTILGPKVVRALLFPLSYSFFLVPFGEEIVPLLQTITAKMSMVFLGWADIPAFIDGVFISTPTGYFEVAEACSGVKFLIAMIAYGALVSNICFQSTRRRILFMSVALIVPIIANGIRAFGTMYIAHHTSLDFATGFDHIFYGWFFFAFVLVLVMALGWPFFDRKIDDAMIDGATIERTVATKTSRLGTRTAAVLIAAIITTPLLWTSVLAAQTSPVPDRIVLPTIAGWNQIDYQPRHDWQPRFDGANHRLIGRYRNASSGAEVDLVIAVYDRQEEGREIVGYGQGAFDPQSSWSWSRDMEAPANGSAIQILAPGPVTRNVMSFYSIGGKITGSPSAVKIETVKSKLFGGNQQAVAILVSAEKNGEMKSRQAMDAFLKSLGPLDYLADEMAGLR